MLKGVFAKNETLANNPFNKFLCCPSMFANIYLYLRISAQILMQINAIPQTASKYSRSRSKIIFRRKPYLQSVLLLHRFLISIHKPLLQVNSSFRHLDNVRVVISFSGQSMSSLQLYCRLNFPFTHSQFIGLRVQN